MGRVHIIQNYLFIFHFNGAAVQLKSLDLNHAIIWKLSMHVAAPFAVSCAFHAGFFKIVLEREMVKPPLDVLKIWINFIFVSFERFVNCGCNSPIT